MGPRLQRHQLRDGATTRGARSLLSERDPWSRESDQRGARSLDLGAAERYVAGALPSCCPRDLQFGLRLPRRAVGAVAVANGVAVLASGGLDSAILVAQLATEGREVTPIYVRFGLAWEDVELRRLRRFLASLGPSRTNPLIVLEQPFTDIDGEHWSLTGQDVPDRDSPDEAVYLPGRNL